MIDRKMVIGGFDFVIIALRIMILIKLGMQAGLVGWFFFATESVALGLALRNYLVAKKRDGSWGGLAVTLCYLAGFALVPTGKGATAVGLVVCLVGMCLSASSLLWLKDSFTAGGSSFVKVRENGLYGFVRHPQSLGRVLIVVGATNYADSLGILRSLCALGLVVSVIVWEESFLWGFESYREYAKRVRYRLLPKIW